MKIMLTILTAVLFTATIMAESRQMMSKQSQDSSLSIKVIKILTPTNVNIIGSAIYGRTGNAPSDQKWLVLQVEMKPYKTGETISSGNINILDAREDIYPLQGITKVDDENFSFLEDIGKPDFSGRRAVGIGLMDENHNIFLYLMKNDEGEIDMFFQNSDPINCLFLFAVPADGNEFNLKIDNLPSINISK